MVSVDGKAVKSGVWNTGVNGLHRVGIGGKNVYILDRMHMNIDLFHYYLIRYNKQNHTSQIMWMLNNEEADDLMEASRLLESIDEQSY